MSTKTIKREQRTIEETHETSKPGIILVISTAHSVSTKTIRTTIHRRTLTPVGFSEVLGYRIEDPCPVGTSTAGCSRYSMKTLEEAHAAFIAEHVAGSSQIIALKEWAERAETEENN